MYPRATPAAHAALHQAQVYAQADHARAAHPIHLLRALTDDPTTPVGDTLRALHLTATPTPAAGVPSCAPTLDTLREHAHHLAGDDREPMDTHHLLYALCQRPDQATVDLLAAHDLSGPALAGLIALVIRGERWHLAHPIRQTPTLAGLAAALAS